MTEKDAEKLAEEIELILRTPWSHRVRFHAEVVEALLRAGGGKP